MILTFLISTIFRFRWPKSKDLDYLDIDRFRFRWPKSKGLDLHDLKV